MDKQQVDNVAIIEEMEARIGGILLEAVECLDGAGVLTILTIVEDLVQDMLLGISARDPGLAEMIIGARALLAGDRVSEAN